MVKLTNLVKDLLSKGFHITEVTLMDNGDLAYTLNGFYKSSGIKIFEESDILYVKARYNEITPLDDETPFDSLVHLNYRWWLYSKNRFDGWTIPEEKWLPYLKEKNLIKEKTITIYE